MRVVFTRVAPAASFALLVTAASLSLTTSTSKMTVAALATSAASSTVPERMQLSYSLRDSLPGLYKANLRPVGFDLTERKVEEGSESLSLKEAAVKHAGSAGSVAFIVRRPGWVLCREHGQQLAVAFAANKDLDPSFFGLWTVIKETGIDDEGLLEFHETFYRHATYRDEALALYEAMGNRKIKLTTWNPFRLYRGMKEMNRRLAEKGISGNLVGEGMIQGGVLIFDKEGNLKYSYDEEIGSEFIMDDILSAAYAVKGRTAATTVETKPEL